MIELTLKNTLEKIKFHFQCIDFAVKTDGTIVFVKVKFLDNNNIEVVESDYQIMKKLSAYYDLPKLKELKK